MLHVVPENRTQVEEHLATIGRTFASVSLRAKRAQGFVQAPGYAAPLPPEKLEIARADARWLIRELMPVADLPHYEAALRVLHEIRRELGTKDPDLAMLRRNLALFLDGVPEG